MGRAAGGSGGAAGGLMKGASKMFKGMIGLGTLLDFGIRKSEGQDTTQAVGGSLSGAGGALAGAAAGAAIGSVVPVVGTAIGGIVGGILGGLGGGKLFDTAYESIYGKADKLKTKTTEEQIAAGAAEAESETIKSPDWTNVKGSDVPVHELDRKMIPKTMWTAEEHITDRQEMQKNLYASSPNFDQSMLRAQNADEILGTENLSFGGPGVKNLRSSAEEANTNLEAKARQRYLEDNKAELDGLERTVKDLNKKVISESNMSKNKGKGIREMQSYAELSEAQKRLHELKFGEVPEKYMMENTIMAANPGEDPEMLYESRNEAMKRYSEKGASERANIEAQKNDLSQLQAKRKEVRNRRGWSGWMMGVDPDKDEIKSLDEKIAAIKGTNGPSGATVGSLELAESRLKNLEREAANPSERQTIGKNVWTGESDTSVIFPGQNAYEATDYHLRSGGNQTEIGPRTDMIPETPAYGEMSPSGSGAVQRNFEALDRFEVLSNAAEQKLMDFHGPALQQTMSEEAAISASMAMETASLQQATPVGQHAVPVMKEDEGVSSVQPVHLRDISESILKDKVESEAGSGKIQSDELVGIEELSNMQYEEMRQIREGIETMISLLRPSGTVGSEQESAMSGRAVRKSVNPTVYGQLRNGQPGSGANKAVQKPYR